MQMGDFCLAPFCFLVSLQGYAVKDGPSGHPKVFLVDWSLLFSVGWEGRGDRRGQLML